MLKGIKKKVKALNDKKSIEGMPKTKTKAPLLLHTLFICILLVVAIYSWMNWSGRAQLALLLVAVANALNILAEFMKNKNSLVRTILKFCVFIVAIVAVCVLIWSFLL